MKAIFISLAAALIPAAISAQSAPKAPAKTVEEPTDTLIVVNNASRVVVTENDNQRSIIVEGTATDPYFYYSYVAENQPVEADTVAADDNEEWGLSLPFLKEKAKKRSNVIWGGQTYIGIAMPIDAPEGLDQSIEVGMGQFVAISRQLGATTNVALGLGFHYQQYALHGGQIFNTIDRQLQITGMPEASASPSSRLRNFGLQIPLTLTQRLAGDFGFAIGASLKINTFTKATSTYHIGNTTYKRDVKGLNQNPVGVDLYAAIGLIDDIGLYVRYTPTRLFNRDNGPRFETISFGITLGL